MNLVDAFAIVDDKTIARDAAQAELDAAVAQAKALVPTT
jgi:hypothetical protein